MSLLARQREARQAEAEQRRDQVERRLRWSAPAGMSAADVGRRLGWPVGAETVLRELADEGRAHQRDGVWYLGPGQRISPADELGAGEAPGAAAAISPPGDAREGAGAGPQPVVADTAALTPLLGGDRSVEPSGSVGGERASSTDPGAAAGRELLAMPRQAGESADTTSEEAPAVLPVPSPPSPAAGDGVEPRTAAGPMEGGAPLHVGDESPGRVAAPEHQDEPPAAPAGETETRNSERAPTPAMEATMDTKARLLELVERRPGISYIEASSALGVTPNRIGQLGQALGLHVERPPRGVARSARVWPAGRGPSEPVTWVAVKSRRKDATKRSAPAAAGSSAAADVSPGVDAREGAEGLETDQGSTTAAPSPEPAGVSPASGAAPDVLRGVIRILEAERDDAIAERDELRTRVLGLEQERANVLELRSQLREAIGDTASLHDDEDIGALAARLLETREAMAAERASALEALRRFETRMERASAESQRAQAEAHALHHQIVEARAHLGRWLVAMHAPPEPGTDPEAEADAHLGRAVAVLMGARP